MKSLLFTLGVLALLGLFAAQDHSRAAPQRDPDPVYRPARTYPDSNDLEQRVGALERQQQRDRAARDAELFAPRPQPTLSLPEPSYPKTPLFEPSYPRIDPLAPSSRSLDWMGQEPASRGR